MALILVLLLMVYLLFGGAMEEPAPLKHVMEPPLRPMYLYGYHYGYDSGHTPKSKSSYDYGSKLNKPSSKHKSQQPSHHHKKSKGKKLM